MGLKASPFIATAPSAPSRSTPRRPTRTRNDASAEASAAEVVASNRVQELEEKISELETLVSGLAEAGDQPLRRRLRDTRMAVNHKFDIAGHEGYLTVGLFEDGQPGELFITMAKEGSTIGGLMDTIGTLTSMALQYGVPLESLVQEIRPPALRAERLHQEPRHPQRHRPSSTTCSAGWAASSWPVTAKAPRHTPRRPTSRWLA